MPRWDEIRRIVDTLPGVAEESSRGRHRWQVAGRNFVRERPLHGPDREALGAVAPAGPILVAYVPDAGVREALVASDPGCYFTTPRFAEDLVILVVLDRIRAGELRDLVVDAWLARAPKRLLRAYAETTSRSEPSSGSKTNPRM